MKYFRLCIVSFHVLVTSTSWVVLAQEPHPYLSNLFATKNSPLYTTYCAAKERSEFTLDEGYHFMFYDSTRGADFVTDNAGDWCLAFKMGATSVYELKQMYKEPVVTTSYADLVKYTYYPFEDVRVDVAFVVHSSRIALQDIVIRNVGKQSVKLQIFPFLRNSHRTFGSVALHKNTSAITFTHEELPDDWVLEHKVPYVGTVHNVFLLSPTPDRVAAVSSSSRAGSDFLTGEPGAELQETGAMSSARIIAASYTVELASGATQNLRVMRAVGRPDEGRQKQIADARQLLTADIGRYGAADELLYAHIPRFTFKDRDTEMLYWSAFTLMRQVMLPPEGTCSYNYYVFSREPQWGWGHGGQVFHESLTMLAYAYMDATSAMNSQRVYRERQHSDGYINYRTGPYLDETIPYNNQLTTSAPWYAWQNWEVYKISKDRKFLEEMYQSSKVFTTYYMKNRDSDGDGLCEWGAHAVLECVRDGRVAVWDEVGWPGNFEALDLNSMLVMEAKALAAMALELGHKEEAGAWELDAAKRAKLINDTMWDEATGFYYSVEKKNHTFTFAKPNDLKREEIIGFLPLWAGIADERHAQKLVQKLTDPHKFWRKYGVPSLSADDSYYNPKGYWNGPVWVEWDYLIVRGLIDYGFVDEARELTNRVAATMVAQLKKDHNLWEFYSPDDEWAGYHKTYIWAGLINRMLMDVERAGTK